MKKKENKALSLLLNLDIAIASTVLALLILEEVQLACMVWVVFAAGGAAFRTGNHVAIEMIVPFPAEGAEDF